MATMPRSALFISSAWLIAAIAGGCGTSDKSSAPEAGTASPPPRIAATPSSDGSTGSTGSSGDANSWRYVALGDSFTAAPRNPTTKPADPCMQSDMNYPHRVGADLGVAELVDVSCGGATIDNVFTEQQTRSDKRPPQIEAVTRDTDLVTISLGLNEGGLYGRVMFGCAARHRVDPEAVCPVVASAVNTSETVGRLHEKIAHAVQAIRARAPGARIVVLGYPTILNPDVVCPQRVPMRKFDVPIAAVLLEKVSEEARQAADTAGALYVDRARLSVGHGVCANDPWINGAVDEPSRASAFHPFPEEQQATAAALEDALGK